MSRPAPKSLTGIWTGHAHLTHSDSPDISVETSTNATMIQIGDILMGTIEGRACYSNGFCGLMQLPTGQIDNDRDPITGTIRAGSVKILICPEDPTSAQIEFDGTVSPDGNRIDGTARYVDIPSFFGGPFHLIRQSNPSPVETESTPRVAELTLA